MKGDKTKTGKKGGRKVSYQAVLNELLDGSFMTRSVIRRNAGLLVLMVVLIFVYISNHYAVIMQLSEIDTLQKELTEVKYEALTRTSDLMKQCRQSYIQTKSVDLQLNLDVSQDPPYTLRKPVKPEE